MCPSRCTGQSHTQTQRLACTASFRLQPPHPIHPPTHSLALQHTGCTHPRPRDLSSPATTRASKLAAGARARPAVPPPHSMPASLTPPADTTTWKVASMSAMMRVKLKKSTCGRAGRRARRLVGGGPGRGVGGRAGERGRRCTARRQAGVQSWRGVRGAAHDLRQVDALQQGERRLLLHGVGAHVGLEAHGLDGAARAGGGAEGRGGAHALERGAAQAAAAGAAKGAGRRGACERQRRRRGRHGWGARAAGGAVCSAPADGQLRRTLAGAHLCC
jgi:hypothetical protein